jgi:uncharacterized Rmd1/YagE family protein
MPEPATLTARALQLGERIDLKGLEREDAFSKSPLAFKTGSGGIAVLFKSGTAVFTGLNPVEEDELVRSLAPRITGPLAEHETETAKLILKAEEEELVGPTGALQLRAFDHNRLLLVAAALGMSASLSWDEKRIAQAFDRISPVAESLKQRKLPGGARSAILEQIGEALSIQHRLAGRADLDDKPDVLWDHPALERFWVKLVDEYDLTQRSRALGRKLDVIRETADTLTELMSTRTSHRLEWYIIALIMIEIVLGLYDRFWK